VEVHHFQLVSNGGFAHFDAEIPLRYPFLNPLCRWKVGVFTRSLDSQTFTSNRHSYSGFFLFAPFGLEMDILEENGQDQKGAFYDDEGVF
jgi:hypothetical protein